MNEGELEGLHQSHKMGKANLPKNILLSHKLDGQRVFEDGYKSSIEYITESNLITFSFDIDLKEKGKSTFTRLSTKNSMYEVLNHFKGKIYQSFKIDDALTSCSEESILSALCTNKNTLEFTNNDLKDKLSRQQIDIARSETNLADALKRKEEYEIPVKYTIDDAHIGILLLTLKSEKPKDKSILKDLNSNILPAIPYDFFYDLQTWMENTLLTETEKRLKTTSKICH